MSTSQIVLLTEKYSGLTGSYTPIIREIISEEKAAQITEFQKDRPSIDGFYRHCLVTPSGTYFFGSVCADILGFIQSKNLPINGQENKPETI